MVKPKMPMKILMERFGNEFRKDVSPSSLEVGVYDAVANFNIGMKWSILIYEKLNIILGAFTLKGCKDINMKH